MFQNVADDALSGTGQVRSLLLILKFLILQGQSENEFGIHHL
jgi:hypothetical protein